MNDKKIEMKTAKTGFNKRHLMWQIFALLVISLGSVFATGAFDDELAKFMPEKNIMVSTYNRKQSGLSGLVEMLTKLGHTPKKWFWTYRSLKEHKGCLVIVAPVVSLRGHELKRILKWVKAGNELVYIDNFKILGSRSLPKKLKVTVKTSVKKLKGEPVKVNQSIDWLKSIGSIKVSANSRLVGGEPLAEDESGAVLISKTYGKGTVIIGVDSRMFSNDLIADKKNWNNFQLFENFASKSSRTIYFDERVHGLTGGQNVYVYLSRGPFGLLSWQLIFIVVIAFLSSAQRFGAPLNISDARRISNLEFINGLTNAYKRAKANASVLEILFHSFRVKVSKLLGVSSHEKDEILISAWNNSPLLDDVNLEQLIDEYNRVMDAKSISDEDLQKMIATCDRIKDNKEKGVLVEDRYAESS